jgi:hypothetical protein
VGRDAEVPRKRTLNDMASEYKEAFMLATRRDGTADLHAELSVTILRSSASVLRLTFRLSATRAVAETTPSRRARLGRDEGSGRRVRVRRRLDGVRENGRMDRRGFWRKGRSRKRFALACAPWHRLVSSLDGSYVTLRSVCASGSPTIMERR